MSDLCKTGCARVREHVRRLASIGGGVMQGQRFASSRLGVQFVDCTVLLALAVIRYCLSALRGVTGNQAGIGDGHEAGVAPSELNMEQHMKHMPAKP